MRPVSTPTFDRTWISCISVLVSCFFLFVSTTAAQYQGAGSRDPATPPTTTAVYARPTSPNLDGWLDDEVWASTPAIYRFTQDYPEDGTPPTERTEVRIVYDREALYICARMFDSDPSAIRGRLGRRDSNTSSDQFLLSIDSYHDHRTTFSFGVNPVGVREDFTTVNDEMDTDSSWDPVWEVATRIDSLGWTAEMRIPFSQLRFSSDEEQMWGINYYRTIFRKSESVKWSWWENEEQGFASHFGHLEGLRGLTPPRRLEILPYTVVKSDHIEGADRTNPFHDGSLQNVTGGVDVNYGLTTDLTLNATINPDFGQVEADPAVVNLTAYETFFAERRPFFVEGANLFRFGASGGELRFGAPQLFYSRRIGHAPSSTIYEPKGYANNPINTSILGAIKISGQSNGWSIGMLDALTGNEYADVQQADGTRRSDPVEPRTNYGVISVRKDLRGGSSGVGLMATTVHRDLSESVFGAMVSSAYTGGVDFFHRFADNRFAVSGTASGSLVNGSTEALTRIQRSSARYFQRPDQDHVSVDSTATSLSGYSASLQFNKISGSWLFATVTSTYSPGFEINDAGIRPGADEIFNSLGITRRWLDPGKVFRSFFINSTWVSVWNFGGIQNFRGAYTGFGGQFLNYWNFNINFNYLLTGLTDGTTRGGPLMERPGQWNLTTFVGSDHRKNVSAWVNTYYERDRYDGWSANLTTGWTLRPSSGISVSLAPSISKSRSMGFYVTQQPDPTALVTYGSRFVFSELEQSSVDLTIRMDVSLTPNLSIQWYAQPFIAAGDYSGFKEFVEPRTFNFRRFGVDGNSTLVYDSESGVFTADPDGEGSAQPIVFNNPDFRFRSIRSNLVFRWEYIPGSTLFLVWNHGRSGYASDPTFRVFDELGNAFRDDMQNTFIVKLNYWFSR